VVIIQKEIENRIAEKMVLGEVAPGDHIKWISKREVSPFRN